MNRFSLITLFSFTILITGCMSGQVKPSKQVFWGPSDEPVKLRFTRDERETKWQRRIQSVLDKGIIPLVDLESSIRQKDAKNYLEEVLHVMDEVGLALIAFDAYQARKTITGQKGYRWSYDIHHIVNAFPDHFILATNSGTNKNWLKQKDSFVDQTVDHVRTGDYPIMGEFDFRHYMSRAQCREGRTDRDTDIPINSANGRRIFALSQETGIAFLIHLEPEDRCLAELEEMLASYPKAKVIWAHFGNIRNPEKQRRFNSELVRRLLNNYPNLYFDIAVSGPGRRYKCGDIDVLDTVMWQDDGYGSQLDKLKPEYKSIFLDFSDRFVVGLDHGASRMPTPKFIRKRPKLSRLILRDLPSEAKHNIGYRNAWLLLTGKPWE